MLKRNKQSDELCESLIESSELRKTTLQTSASTSSERSNLASTAPKERSIYERSPTPPVIEFRSSLTGVITSRELADVGRRKWTQLVWQCCKCTPIGHSEYALKHFHVHWLTAQDSEALGKHSTESHGFFGEDSGFSLVGIPVRHPTATLTVRVAQAHLHGENKREEQHDEESSMYDGDDHVYPDICDGQHDVDDEYDMVYADPNRLRDYGGHQKCSSCLEYAIVTYVKRVGEKRVPVCVRMSSLDATLFLQEDRGWADRNGEYRWAVIDEVD